MPRLVVLSTIARTTRCFSLPIELVAGVSPKNGGGAVGEVGAGVGPAPTLKTGTPSFFATRYAA
jgi:hypothetical protein